MSAIDIIALNIPIITIMVAIVVIIFIAAYFEYKKKMAMIEKGIIPEEEKEKHKSPENKLAWGVAILGIGISLLISWRFNFSGEYTAGLIFISIGIGLLASHFWKETRTNE